MAESVDINAPLDYLSVFDVHSFEVHVRDLYFIGGQLLKTFKALFTNLKPWANIQIFCNIIDIWRDHWDQSSEFLFWRKRQECLSQINQSLREYLKFANTLIDSCN